MRTAFVLALVLAAACVDAAPKDKPALAGTAPTDAHLVSPNARKIRPRTRNAVAAPSAAVAVGGRRMLKGTEGTSFYAYESATTAQCPAAGSENTPFAELEFMPGASQIINKGICTGTATPSGVTTVGGTKLYGAAAQDYGSGKSSWETYGWTKFTVPDPSITDLTTVQFDGINLHVLGAVGNGHPVGRFCTVEAVSIAIYPDTAGVPDATPTHSVKVLLPGNNVGSTFTFNSNSSAVLSLDIVDLFDNSTGTVGNNLQLTIGSIYWLRVKFFVPYTGSSGTGTGKCFAFWGMRTTSDGSRGRWQENAGGAAGYSTTCKGAAAGTSPGVGQTFFNCFNNGAAAATAVDSTGIRRCLTYRTQLVPALAVADCAAKFHDFNYGFYSYVAMSPAGGSP